MEKTKKDKKKLEKSQQETKETIVAARGRVFQGKVIRKFPGRITIEFDRTVFIPKYERYMVKKTRIHARLPKTVNAEMGDFVKVQECRPLSKIIHFIALEVIRKAGEK